LLAFLSKQTTLKLGAVMMTVIPLLLAVHYVIANQARGYQMPGDFLQQYRDRIPADTIIIAEGSIIRAVDWYLHRDDVFLIQEDELAYGLHYPDASDRYLNAGRFQQLLETNAGRRDILLLCRSSCANDLDALLPADAEYRVSGKFRVWHVAGSGD
jgi:hypothetical protein